MESYDADSICDKCGNYVEVLGLDGEIQGRDYNDELAQLDKEAEQAHYQMQAEEQDKEVQELEARNADAALDEQMRKELSKQQAWNEALQELEDMVEKFKAEENQ